MENNHKAQSDILTVTVEAPCTIANLVCGFDILGMALTLPSDTLTLTRVSRPGITLEHLDEFDLPADPDKNIVGIVFKSAQQQFPMEGGLHAQIRKAVRPGSGLGSSASSAASAAYAYYELFIRGVQNQDDANGRSDTHVRADTHSLQSAGYRENRLMPNQNDVMEWAMSGEEFASGTRHADNLAPCLYGGITLVQTGPPLQITPLRIPDLYVVVLHPECIIRTAEARNILPKQISLQTGIRQLGFVAGFVAGLEQNNPQIIAANMHDLFAEPFRSTLIPGFSEVMQAGTTKGALGGGIAGSGPAVFMFAEGEAVTNQVAQAMEVAFRKGGINCTTWVTKISRQGVRCIESNENQLRTDLL